MYKIRFIPIVRFLAHRAQSGKFTNYYRDFITYSQVPACTYPEKGQLIKGPSGSRRMDLTTTNYISAVSTKPLTDPQKRPLRHFWWIGAP